MRPMGRRGMRGGGGGMQRPPMRGPIGGMPMGNSGNAGMLSSLVGRGAPPPQMDQAANSFRNALGGGGMATPPGMISANENPGNRPDISASRPMQAFGGNLRRRMGFGE